MANRSTGGNSHSAFIATHPNVHFGDVLHGPHPNVQIGFAPVALLGSNTRNPIQGEAIGKIGMTTGFTTGTVDSILFHGMVGGIAFVGTFTSNVISAGGDSGGVVFCLLNLQPRGIVALSWDTPWPSPWVGFSGAGNIHTRLGVTR